MVHRHDASVKLLLDSDASKAFAAGQLDALLAWVLCAHTAEGQTDRRHRWLRAVEAAPAAAATS